MYHFYICSQMTKLRNRGIKEEWVEYIFQNLYTNGENLSTLAVCIEAEVEKRIAHFGLRPMPQNLMKTSLRLVLHSRVSITRLSFLCLTWPYL